MSLLKIPIILATALAADITITPPNPPPQQDELLSYANSMTDFSKSFSVGALGFAKVCFCLPTLHRLLNLFRHREAIGLCVCAKSR